MGLVKDSSPGSPGTTDMKQGYRDAEGAVSTCDRSGHLPGPVQEGGTEKGAVGYRAGAKCDTSSASRGGSEMPSIEAGKGNLTTKPTEKGVTPGPVRVMESKKFGRVTPNG